MKRAIIALVVLAALSGCERKPAEASATAGVGFVVERLFTHDGCTVYRFVDVYTRYFTKCDGAATSHMGWSESCGKNCTRPVEIPTAYAAAPDQRPKP